MSHNRTGIVKARQGECNVDEMMADAIYSRGLGEQLELQVDVKQIPAALTEHILPFDWYVEKVWALVTAQQSVSRQRFDYLLDLPMWSSQFGKGLTFDLCPIEVIRKPSVSAIHAARITNADLEFPLDFLECSGRVWLLDGLHRLARAFRENVETLSIRIHGEEVIPEIRNS